MNCRFRNSTRLLADLPVVTALLLAAFAAPPASASLVLENGFEIFNTGEGLGLGVIDPRYPMTLHPGAPATAMVVQAPFLTPNNAASAWVSPLFPNQQAAFAEFRISTQIDLTGIDLTNFTITGFWVSDNRGVDILVNGNSTGQTNSGSHQNPVDATAANAFTLFQHLVAGVNTIEFAWGNGPPFGGNTVFPDPTSVRVEFREVALPEPSTLALFGLGVVIGLAGLRRR